MTETRPRFTTTIDLDLGTPDRLSPAATAGLIGQTVRLHGVVGDWAQPLGRATIEDARVDGEDGQYLVLTLAVEAGEIPAPLVEGTPKDPVPGALGFKVDAAHRDESGVRIFDRVRLFEVGPLSVAPVGFGRGAMVCEPEQ